MNKIPIVDLSRLSDADGSIPSQSDWNETVKEIERALHGIGFVYVINHGLSEETVKKILVHDIIEI
jgi:isopenicillin N synthase-like dioxygenase